MSKKYSTPSLQIVHIDASDIIATSPGLRNSSSDTTNWNLSRSRDDSDMDDE